MAVKTPKVRPEKLADTPPIPSKHESSLGAATCITVIERENECDDDLIKHPSHQEYDIIDFSNGYFLTTLAYAIWVVVFVANIYAIAMIGMGQTGQ